MATRPSPKQDLNKAFHADCADPRSPPIAARIPPTNASSINIDVPPSTAPTIEDKIKSMPGILLLDPIATAPRTITRNEKPTLPNRVQQPFGHYPPSQPIQCRPPSK